MDSGQLANRLQTAVVLIDADWTGKTELAGKDAEMVSTCPHFQMAISN